MDLELKIRLDTSIYVTSNSRRREYTSDVVDIGFFI